MLVAMVNPRYRLYDASHSPLRCEPTMTIPRTFTSYVSGYGESAVPTLSASERSSIDVSERTLHGVRDGIDSSVDSCDARHPGQTNLFSPPITEPDPPDTRCREVTRNLTRENRLTPMYMVRSDVGEAHVERETCSLALTLLCTGQSRLLTMMSRHPVSDVVSNLSRKGPSLTLPIPHCDVNLP